MLVLVYELVGVVPNEDVLPGEVHEEVVVAVPLILSDVSLVLVFLDFNAQHGVVDELPKVNSSLRCTATPLQVRVERLIVDEAVKLGCNMGHDLYLFGLLSNVEAPGVVGEEVNETMAAEAGKFAIPICSASGIVWLLPGFTNSRPITVGAHLNKLVMRTDQVSSAFAACAPYEAVLADRTTSTSSAVSSSLSMFADCPAHAHLALAFKIVVFADLCAPTISTILLTLPV